MKKLGILAALLALPIFAGCAGGYPVPADGFLFVSVTAPGWYPGVTNQIGAKTGSSAATGFVGLIATGDASIEAAARAGGITKIHSVANKWTKILGGLYWKFETHITGE
jgi:hypothetical protein